MDLGEPLREWEEPWDQPVELPERETAEPEKVPA